MESAVPHQIVRVAKDSAWEDTDLLAVEEPLEIRLRFGFPAVTKNLAVTMRTPGHDEELALGFLFTEGIITDASAVTAITRPADTCTINNGNVVLVTLHQNVMPNILQAERNFYTTSSCGVCGKASINAIRVIQSPLLPGAALQPISAHVLNSLTAAINAAQNIFQSTGGLHAASLFSHTGELLLLREDVGRHNAVDKLIGASIANPLIRPSDFILLLSGRASFELVQKAAMAGIPVIAAIGAPSSLAVSLAREFGITLVGFLRNERFNIYSGEHRIQIPVYENTP